MYLKLLSYDSYEAVHPAFVETQFVAFAGRWLWQLNLGHSSWESQKTTPSATIQM